MSPLTASILSPSSVAVIGGSDRPGSVGQVVVNNILAAGFGGAVHVVNPRAQAIPGTRWAASVAQLPSAPDLAVVVTPAQITPQVIEELGQIGTRTAVVISAGFTDDNGLRQALRIAARGSGVRIIGPNGLGLAAPHARLNASFARGLVRPGRLGFISQSGALVSGVIDWAGAREVGFSAIISGGDMLDADLADLVDLLAADPHTDAILLYIEGVGEAGRFLSAAHAASRTKPVVALKAGRTREAGRAAATHTGALVGDHEVELCGLSRAGVVIVDSLSELFEAAEVLRTARGAHGERLAIITNGGGAGVLALDALGRGAGRPAQLTAGTTALLDAKLPPAWSRSNPIDLIGDADAARYADALKIALAADEVDAVLMINCPTALNPPEPLARAVAETMIAAHAEGCVKPVIGCWLGESNRRAAEPVLASALIPVLDTPDAAIRAFGHLLQSRRGARGLSVAPSPPAAAPGARATAQAMIDAARAEQRTSLTEVEAKRLLALYGVEVVPTRLAASVEAVADACAALSPPYVIKAISPDLIHKSEAGGVALNLADEVAALRAAQAMSSRLHALPYPPRLTGFAVQTMARAGGVDLIVGLAHDRVFGPVVMVGAGGKAVEVLDDKQVGLPPLDANLAREMIARTRVSRLLAGYRDEPPARLEAVIQTIQALSAIAIDLPDIVGLDINPLRVNEDGAVALDARMIITAEPAAPRLAIMPAPTAWTRALTTRTGAVMQVRPARPDDAPLLSDFFARLTPEDLRLRFLGPVLRLDDQRLSMMAAVDYRRTMTFLAFDTGGDLVATAMLASGADPERAEVAVSVRSDLKGLGLGWTLLEHTMAYARERGVRVVQSLESADNVEALQVEDDMGFSVRVSPDDVGLRVVERRLAPSSEA